jgi:predicted component of type VI protein secretion system
MRLHLRIKNAAEQEAQRTLDPPGGILGRSTDSTVQLSYESISRQHAELRHDGCAWWLKNRSQTSTTILDDELVAPGAQRQLSPRGVLTLGRVVLEYHQEPLPLLQRPVPESAPLPSEATLVLPRRAIVAVPQSVLAQLSPVRAAAPDPPPLPAPPTLIRRPAARPPPPPPPAALISSPPTLIRQLRPPPAPPAKMVQEPPSGSGKPAVAMAAQAQPMAQAAVLPMVEHRPLPAPPPPSSATPQDNLNIVLLREKALELLQPFGRSLEQAGEALRQGEVDRARTLLRGASFALADLRDLFQD